MDRKRCFPFWAVVAILPMGLMGSDGSGSTGVPFLTLGVGARALAMGEAAVASPTDASTLYWNPGGLLAMERRSVVFMHSSQIEGSTFDFAAYGSRSERSALAMGVQYYAPGKVDQTDSSGNPVGTLSPKDVALSGGYARRFRWGDAGVSAKYVQSKLVDTAKTMALDAGIMSRGLFNDKLRAGASLSNVGGHVKYDQESAPLPTVFRAGLSGAPWKGWLAAMDVVAPRGDDVYPALGAEYNFKPMEKIAMAMRVGYNGRSDVGGRAEGMSAGVGFVWSGFAVDYAFVSNGDLDPSQVISVGYAF